MTLLHTAKISQRGVSIIEIATALAVLAILLVLGIPTFTEWIGNARIRTAAESLMSGLQSARNEAVRRNASVQFTLRSPGVASGTGWTVTLAATGEELQSAPNGEGTGLIVVTPTPADANAVTFTGLGRTPAPPANLNLDGSSLLTQLDVDSSGLPAATSREMRIMISSGGQIRMCDPNVGDATDPRAC